MKKLLLIVLMFACGITVTLAQKPAEIKFDKLTQNILRKRARCQLCFHLYECW